jgi:hypothetical protein
MIASSSPGSVAETLSSTCSVAGSMTSIVCALLTAPP